MSLEPRAKLPQSLMEARAARARSADAEVTITIERTGCDARRPRPRMPQSPSETRFSVSSTMFTSGWGALLSGEAQLASKDKRCSARHRDGRGAAHRERDEPRKAVRVVAIEAVKAEVAEHPDAQHATPTPSFQKSARLTTGSATNAVRPQVEHARTLLFVLPGSICFLSRRRPIGSSAPIWVGLLLITSAKQGLPSARLTPIRG